MPLSSDLDDILATPITPQPVEEQEAPYTQQFLRGLARGSTFGMWEPFKEAGKGGLTETAGNIAGTAASFIPVARGVGAGVGALGKFAPALLRAGVGSGEAVANMARLGRQVGPSLSGLGSALTVGAAVPLHSELEAQGEQAFQGVTPPPLKQRLMTSAIGAGLGAIGGRMLAKDATRTLAGAGAGAAGATATDLSSSLNLIGRKIGLVKEQLASATGPEAKMLGEELTDLTNRYNVIDALIKTKTPPGAVAEAVGEKLPPVEDFIKQNLERTGMKADMPMAEAQWQSEKGALGPGGQSPRDLGTWMKENIPPEVLHGAEYAAPLGDTVKIPDFTTTASEHFRSLYESLQRARQVPSTIDAVAASAGKQVMDGGQRVASDLAAAVHTVDNPGVPPEGVIRTIGGGSDVTVGGHPVQSFMAPGPTAAARKFMGFLRDNVGQKWTQILPIRTMLLDVPIAGALPDALSFIRTQMKTMRQDLWNRVPDVAAWDKPTETIVRQLFQTHASDAPEVFYNAVREQAPQAVNGVNQLRGVMDEIWGRLVANDVLDPKQRILNYFPNVRERLQAQATGLQLMEKGKGYVPIELQNLLNGVNPQFVRRRTLKAAEDVPQNVPMKDVLNMYFTQFARHSTINDAKDELNTMLQAVPGTYKEAIAQHMNFWLGRDTPTVSIANRFIRDYNYVRAIGFNVMSPVKNLMTMINTYAVTPQDAFIKGFRDMKDPAKLALIESKGLGSMLKGRSELDDLLEAQDNPQIGGVWKALRNASGKWFQQTAEYTRLHALMAGMRMGEARGITNPDELVKFGWSVMGQTQFHIGDQASNLSPAFQTEMGRIVGQFQGFRLNQMHFMTRLVDQAREGFMSGDPKKALDGMLPFVKFWAPTIALTGSMGVLPGDWAEDSVTRALFGKAMHVPGLTELLFGVAIPTGLGLGSIEARDLNSFISYFPGPTVGLLQGLAGAATGIDAGQGLDLTKAGRELSQEERARLIVSSLPGGVQTNRVLQMLRLIQNDGYYQRALDWPEFLGIEKPNGPLISDKAMSLEQSILSAAGYQPAERQQQFRQFHMLGQIENDLKQVTQRASAFRAAGKDHEAQQIVDAFNKKYEDQLPAPLNPVTASSLRSAIKAQVTPPELRRKLPMGLRGMDDILRPPALIGE